MTKRGTNKAPESFEKQTVDPFLAPVSFTPEEGPKILELRTEGVLFRNLIASLKMVLIEANIEFSEKEVKLAAVDSKKYALVHLKLDPASFQYFHCPKKLTLGFDIEKLQFSFSTNKIHERICMTVRESDPSTLAIRYSSPQGGSHTYDEINLLSLQEYNISDKIEYAIPCDVNAKYFQTICRDFAAFHATHMKIETVGNELILENKGGFMKKRRVTIPIVVPEGAVPLPPAKGVFILSHLKSFSKAENVSRVVRLYLKNDEPLTCEYDVGDMGKLMYLLSGEKDQDD